MIVLELIFFRVVELYCEVANRRDRAGGILEEGEAEHPLFAEPAHCIPPIEMPSISWELLRVRNHAPQRGPRAAASEGATFPRQPPRPAADTRPKLSSCRKGCKHRMMGQL